MAREHLGLADRMVVPRDHETSTSRGLDPDDTKYAMFYQITRLARDKGSLIPDAGLDVLAGAVKWSPLDMAAKPEKAVEKRHEEEAKRFSKKTTDGLSMPAGGCRRVPKGRLEAPEVVDRWVDPHDLSISCEVFAKSGRAICRSTTRSRRE